MEQRIYNVRLDGIDIIEKAVFKTQVLEGDVFNFDIEVQTVADSIKNMLITFVNVRVNRKHTTDIFARLAVGFGYFIENFEDTLKKDEDDKYIIPADLEAMLKQISISTIRGIMFSEFRGTHLHKAILPILLSESLVAVGEESN
jgi:hypothetical protein